MKRLKGTVFVALLGLSLGGCNGSDNTLPQTGNQTPTTLSGTTVGRINYDVRTTPPATPPGPDDYVGIRLKILDVEGGPATNVDDPTWQQKLFSSLYSQTDNVFVGIRFVNGPYEILDPAGSGTTSPAVPFYTVLEASRSSASASQPVTNDGGLVLGYREPQFGGVDLQIANVWGKAVSTTIPGDAILAARAALTFIPATAIPAAVVNSITSFNSSDRTRADNFADQVFSSSGGSMTSPTVSTTRTLSASELGTGIIVNIKIFDRTATEQGAKEVISFSLTTEYLPSVLPQTPPTDPSNQAKLFTNWANNASSSTPLVAGNANTTPISLLQYVPVTGPTIASSLDDDSTFDKACNDLPSDFAQLGFNKPDQYALTWIVLKDSRVLNEIGSLNPSSAAVTFSQGPDCPNDQMNQSFASWGLPTLESPLTQLGQSPEQKQADALTHVFAFAWANQSDFSSLFDPNYKNVLFYQNDGPLPNISPLTSTQLDSELKAISPTGMGEISHRTDLNGFCVLFNAQGKEYIGAIKFAPNSTSIISEIDIGGPKECIDDPPSI